MKTHKEVLDEWYEANEKFDLRCKYNLTENDTIYDLGAYTGKWAIEMYNRYKCTIYCFEPVKDSFNKLKERVKNYSNVIPINFGVGGETRNDIIYLNKDGSSIVNKTKNIENIKIISINKMLKDFPFKNNAFLKMNIEGAEFEVLEKLIQKNMLNKFKYYQIQFHRDVSKYKERREKIRNELAKTYKELYNFEFVWESWERNDK